MLNRGLIRTGFVLESMAEFLYFIIILRPGLFSISIALLISLMYVVSSVLIYIGFNERTTPLSIGFFGAVLLMFGSLLLLIMYFTSMSRLIAMLGMGVAFLGDVSLSLFFWRAVEHSVLVRVGAVLNAIPVITFVGSLLLAIGINEVENVG